MEKYTSKYEAKRFINFLKERINDIDLNCDIKSIIKDSVNLNDAYLKVGQFYSDMGLSYKGIVFREDLFDVLIKKYDLEFTKSLVECVRKGKFNDFMQKDILSNQFKKWACLVKYLPSRELLFNENELLYEEYLKKYQYSNLSKKDLLKEIKLLIIFNGFSSINSIQNRFCIGFNRTLNLLEDLKEEGFLVRINNTYRYEAK